MGKHKSTTKGGRGAQMGASSIPSSHGGEQGDTGNTAQTLMDEVASMEEVFSQMGTPFKMPFRFTQLSRSPSEWSLSPECCGDCSITPKDHTHYCVHTRVSLGEGRGDQPSPSHAWNWLLITNILQEVCPRDCITEAVVLVPGEAILFFGRCLHNEGLLHCDAQDIEHGLMGSITGAGRTAWVEATVKTLQEGHRAIADAILEMKTKARGPGHPKGPKGAAQSSAAACNIDNWMQGLNKEPSNGEVRKAGNVHTHGYVWGGTHAWHVSGGGRWHRQQRTPLVPRGSPGGSPSSGGWSSDWGSK